MGLKQYDLDGIEKKKKAVIETKNGEIVIELFPETAPNTVANFAHLAEEGFYNGLTFHRVIAGFVAQGGCPNGIGNGGPGWHIACETKNNPAHERGTLSMAHAGKNTGGSQFFICFDPQPHLNGVHTVFGQVREGFDALDAIKQDDKMLKVTISEG